MRTPHWSRSRRGFLAGALLNAASAPAAEATPVDERDSIRTAQEEVWRRFIDARHGTFYDYVTPSGEIRIPTPEECASGKPNALGWSSPIENGAFFGGLYLDALCNRWKQAREELVARRAKTIASGLIQLARIGSTPGFVARGISTDGASHYAASSSDQTFQIGRASCRERV